MEVITETIKIHFYNTIHPIVYNELMTDFEFDILSGLTRKLYDPLVNDLGLRFSNHMDEKLEDDLDINGKQIIFK